MPNGTWPQDSLRLRLQGRAFTDKAWADHQQIVALARIFHVIVAIVDTRDPHYRLIYHSIVKCQLTFHQTTTNIA